MAEIINLNKARKARTRAATKAVAQGNVVKFGISKAERQLAEAEAEKARRELDAHARDQGAPDPT